MLTYGGPGRKALVFEPTYALHSHIARLTGTEVVVGARRDDFSVDPDAARALIETHTIEGEAMLRRETSRTTRSSPRWRSPRIVRAVSSSH